LKTNTGLLPHTFHLPKITFKTLEKSNRLLGIQKKNIISSTHHKFYKGKMTIIHTLITLSHKPINFTNEIPFIYKSPLTQYLLSNFVYIYYLKTVPNKQKILYG